MQSKPTTLPRSPVSFASSRLVSPKPHPASSTRAPRRARPVQRGERHPAVLAGRSPPAAVSCARIVPYVPPAEAALHVRLDCARRCARERHFVLREERESVDTRAGGEVLGGASGD